MAAEDEELEATPAADSTSAADPKAEKARLKAEKKAAKRAKKRKKKGGEEGDDEERETVGSKIAVFFVTLLIIFIWLAIFALLIKADVGGFGSSVMRPLIGNVPILNKILPDDPNTPEGEQEVSSEDAKYRYKNMDEAVAYIKELELQLAEAQQSDEADAAHVAELEAEVAKLRTLEQEQASYEAVKQKFYEEVVFSDKAPDINEYIEYYQSIDPENAEVLYREALKQKAVSDELEAYIKKYSSMSAKAAAGIFDAMTDNLPLVAEILTNMDADSAGAILAKMNADTAAKVTEIMHPVNTYTVPDTVQ